MPVEGEYEPSPAAWVREQVEAYERSGGKEANTLRDIMPSIQHHDRQAQQPEQQITNGSAQRTASTQRSQSVGWSGKVPTVER